MSAITSYFTLNIISSVIKGIPGQMSNGGLINFGEFDNASYNFYQLLIFAFMGLVGGVSGKYSVLKTIFLKVDLTDLNKTQICRILPYFFQLLLLLLKPCHCILGSI